MNLDEASNDWWINDVTHCCFVINIALKLLTTVNYAKTELQFQKIYLLNRIIVSGFITFGTLIFIVLLCKIQQTEI